MAPRTSNTSVLAKDVLDVSSRERVPADKPDFTVKDLRRAVPKHCFEKNHFMSFAYLIVDAAIIAALFFTARFFDDNITKDGIFGVYAPYARYVMWCAYWAVQGSVMTGMWVIGHECGHGGFSDNVIVGDTVGFFVHNIFLLVPYWSWKVSHRRHHSNTGNMARDEVFVPNHEEEASDNPILWSAPVRLFYIVMTLTVGWPLYLLFNTTGHFYKGAAWVNHFWPYSPIFSKRERFFVFVSDLGLVAAFYLMYLAANEWGAENVFKYYFVPYLVTNHWLVLITLLQHTDPVLPHYTNTEWDWLRGALATVDRDWGILNIVLHHIHDTHVLHHIFHTIPHYHAEEASEAIKPIIGNYYRRFNDGPYPAIWKAFRTCAFVREEKKGSGILWFHPADAKGKAKTA